MPRLLFPFRQAILNTTLPEKIARHDTDNARIGFQGYLCAVIKFDVYYFPHRCGWSSRTTVPGL